MNNEITRIPASHRNRQVKVRQDYLVPQAWQDPVL
jgi:hypothetical protein